MVPPPCRRPLSDRSVRGAAQTCAQGIGLLAQGAELAVDLLPGGLIQQEIAPLQTLHRLLVGVQIFGQGFQLFHPVFMQGPERLHGSLQRLIRPGAYLLQCGDLCLGSSILLSQRPQCLLQGLQAVLCIHQPLLCLGQLLLEGLLRGTLLNTEASAEMLSILRNQRLNGKMPFYLHSRGVPVAHKTGEDDGITHDVGIIYQDDPVIFCFLSNDTVVPQAERAIQEIAAML